MKTKGKNVEQKKRCFLSHKKGDFESQMNAIVSNKKKTHTHNEGWQQKLTQWNFVHKSIFSGLVELISYFWL